MDNDKRKRFIESFIDIMMDNKVIQDSCRLKTKSYINPEYPVNFTKVTLSFELSDMDMEESKEWGLLFKEAYDEFRKQVKL